jgi:hypothetical protein
MFQVGFSNVEKFDLCPDCPIYPRSQDSKYSSWVAGLIPMCNPRSRLSQDLTSHYCVPWIETESSNETPEADRHRSTVASLQSGWGWKGHYGTLWDTAKACLCTFPIFPLLALLALPHTWDFFKAAHLAAYSHCCVRALETAAAAATCFVTNWIRLKVDWIKLLWNLNEI